MRRFLFGFFVASLLGVSPLPFFGAEASARPSRTASKGKSKKSTPSKSVPKFESKADPAATAMDPVTGEASATGSGSGSAPPPSRGPSRIDFDDRLIQGQTNKSGAVYLYDRKELKVKSMIKERDSFRSETLSTVYDQ
jgi:hypothetical protein